MKKTLAILLMLLIAVGCDDSTETEQPTEHPAEQPTEQAAESITNTLGMKFNKIPAGTFLMGSPETDEGRYRNEHQHEVTITQAFYIQTTEVTQGQWKALMGTEPWKDEYYVKEGPDYAASYVSWDDAVAYCKKLSEKEGKTYRLPTEAEWEYACRAGTQTTWSFGDDEKELGDYAWYRKNARDIGEEYAHQVGLKKPNAYGLYDMYGNVWEWCDDYFGDDYYNQSPEQDPRGPASGYFRALRGGTWRDNSRFTRSAERGRFVARRNAYGFRVVRELDDSEPLRTQAEEITAAITAAIGKGDWETVLALDPDNEAGTKLKAAAVAAALATGDWKAVLALDATNSEGLRMQAAFTEKAVAAALVKGDWKEVLALDATNSEGLRMQAHELAPITNTIGMKLNLIPAGTFLMGTPESEAGRDDDETQHKVTISKPFYMQTTEVTQGQWKALMGTEPWKDDGFPKYVKEGANYPASNLSWDDAFAYCKKLSEKEGKTYRLPTEAEWEYACRAGTKTAWSSGDDEKELGDYAWSRENTWGIGEFYAHQVGLKKPNAFGLYDMHGNVEELCHDYYGEDYYKQSPEKDPQGPVTGMARVYRGGSWNISTPWARSAFRNRTHIGLFYYGFRLVRELD